MSGMSGMSGMSAPRAAYQHRVTNETDVEVRVGLDGDGTQVEARTGIPFFDHMLEQIAKHGGLDLDVRAAGDLEVDLHHTVEDVGITFGAALREALGEKRGVRRFADALVPLDEALVQVALDLSGRPPSIAARTGASRWLARSARTQAPKFPTPGTTTPLARPSTRGSSVSTASAPRCTSALCADARLPMP